MLSNFIGRAPENLSCIKRNLIALDLLDRVNCVSALVVVWELTGVFLFGFINVRCLTSRLDPLTFCGTIVGLLCTWYWLILGTTSSPKALNYATSRGFLYDCMAIIINIGLGMSNQISWYLELHILTVESYCVVLEPYNFWNLTVVPSPRCG